MKALAKDDSRLLLSQFHAASPSVIPACSIAHEAAGVSRMISDELVRMAGEIELFDAKLGSLVSKLLVPSSEEEYESVMRSIEDRLLERIEQGMDDAPHDLSWKWGGGIAIKEMKVLAGTLIVGKAHTEEHFNVVSMGSIMLFTPEGPVMASHGAVFLAEAGSRKVGLSLSECCFLNVFANPEGIEGDDRLEARFMVDSERYIIHNERMRQLSLGKDSQ